MRLLLDTHAFLWLDAHPELLSPKVRIACQDRTNILFLSIVSLWEMQVKYKLVSSHWGNRFHHYR